MLFVPSVRSDIQKYYMNTFLKFKETGDLLLYLTGVDNYSITGQVEDGRDFKLYMAEDTPYEVDYILPHKSFFQYGQHAVMLQRIPAKQYFRGISPENTSVTYKKPGQEIPSPLPLSFEILKAFVQKQKFLKLSEALTADLSSCVLGSRMMYMRANKTIYIDFHPVAKLASNNKHIVMYAPIFQEDIKEFLNLTQESDKFIFAEKK